MEHVSGGAARGTGRGGANKIYSAEFTAHLARDARAGKKLGDNLIFRL